LHVGGCRYMERQCSKKKSKRQIQEDKFRKWTDSLLTVERKTMTIGDLRKAFKLQDYDEERYPEKTIIESEEFENPL